MSAPPNPDAEGRIITFYSFKGGTGRSMALANVASLLARGGIGAESAGARPVLAIDWDLEAPGLHRYLAAFLPDTAGQPGIVELFLELDEATRQYSPQGSDEDQQAANAVLESVGLNRFVVGTTVPNLSFMSAGRFDKGYPGRVSGFRWDLLHERMPELIPALSRKLAERFSYVLIDSRTGFTDTSGICTMLMPELLVAVFTPNLQSLSRASWTLSGTLPSIVAAPPTSVRWSSSRSLRESSRPGPSCSSTGATARPRITSSATSRPSSRPSRTFTALSVAT